MSHSMMVGMFWGGVVMALPPVLLGLAILVLVYRHHRGRNAAPPEPGSGH